MGKRNQHVVPLGNGWAVKAEGNKKFTVITETQRDAIAIAKGIAQNNKSEVVIYAKNGKIRDKDSYVKDSTTPKNKKH